MDYDASIEVMLQAGLEEYLFAACSENLRSKLIKKYKFHDECDPIGKDLEEKNVQRLVVSMMRISCLKHYYVVTLECC